MEGISFAEAGELGDIIQVNDAWCPKCGRVRPEMLAFPFTADRDIFKAYQPNCPVCGAALRLDAETAEAALNQHMEIFTDELGSRPTIVVRPIKPGNWHAGITSQQPDRPSGAAPQPSELSPLDVYLRERANQS